MSYMKRYLEDLLYDDEVSEDEKEFIETIFENKED